MMPAMAAWMLQALGIGALCAVGALAVEWACRARRWPTRWAWAVALALTALLVATAPLRRAPTSFERTLRAVDGAEVAGAVVAPTTMDRARVLLVVVRAGLARPVDALVRVLDGPRATVAAPWLAGAWALLSAALLATALVVAWRLARERRRWPVVPLHGEVVRLSPRFGPAVLGLARGGIVVPRWLLGCDAAAQRLAIAHEREHLRARDPVLLALGGAVVVLLPWHPVAWWMLARLRLAVELDCDRRVIAAGVPAADYGALLIDVAGRGAGAPFGVPMLGVPTLAARPTHLERRLVAMTSPRPRHARARLAVAAAVTLAAVLAACESRLPTSAEVEEMDVAGAERKLSLAGDTSLTFFVNDLRVSAAEAHAIAPERIASMTVSGDAAGGPRKTIRIATTGDTASVRALLPKRVQLSEMAPAGAPRMQERRFDGLVFLDGVRTTHAAVAAVAAEKILTIDVIKGDAARALYPNEPAAANGVIRITTKKGAGS